MLGTYRFALALLVMFSHVCGGVVIGWYAVHGFFILSGFLMTLVLHQSYGFSFEGFWRFILNRILRLYPLYWAAFAFALGLICYVGVQSSQNFSEDMAIPRDIKDWLSNISLIYPNFFPSRVSVQVIPPSFTLTIELLFYSLMALGLSRKKIYCWLWLGAAIIYMAATHIINLPINWRYSTLAAGALPFSMGALLYHYLDQIIEREAILARSETQIWLITFMILNAFFAVLFWRNLEGVFVSLTYYMNMVLNLLFILHLLARNRQRQGDLKRDAVLGELSYPIYLIHMPVAMFLSITLSGIIGINSFAMFVFVFAVTLVISFALVILVDRPMQKIRAKVKPKKPYTERRPA